MTLSTNYLLFLCFTEFYFRRGSVMDACTFFSLGAVRTLVSMWKLADSKLGDAVERHTLTVCFGSFDNPGTARARPSPVTLHPITRMPTHMCARFSPLQGSFARWRARTAAIKGCLLAYASSCARCRAARRAPPPLRGARSRTGGRTVGRSCRSWKM